MTEHPPLAPALAARLIRLAFPEPPRRLPGERALNIACRTLHILASGILLGGHVFDVAPHRLETLLWATVASGAGLIGLELYRTAHFVYLGQGIMVWAKLALVLAGGLWWDQRVALLAAAAVLASIGSHMPSGYRHFSVRHGRVLE